MNITNNNKSYAPPIICLLVILIFRYNACTYRYACASARISVITKYSRAHVASSVVRARKYKTDVFGGEEKEEEKGGYPLQGKPRQGSARGAAPFIPAVRVKTPAARTQKIQ